MGPIVHYGSEHDYWYLRTADGSELRAYPGRVDGSRFDGWPETDFSQYTVQFVFDQVGDRPAVLMLFDRNERNAHGHVPIGTIPWSPRIHNWILQANQLMARPAEPPR